MMKKYILLLLTMLFLVACETGTRYDKNTTIEKVPTKPIIQGGLIEKDDIEALLVDQEDDELWNDVSAWIDPEVKDKLRDEVKEEELTPVSSRRNVSGLDVGKIREGRHDDYTRLVFDIYDKQNKAKRVGEYDAKYDSSKKDIAVILHGYQKFSAPLPSFPPSSLVAQIYFDEYPENSGFKFHIKLHQNATVKIFDLKNPARLVFDIKAI